MTRAALTWIAVLALLLRSLAPAEAAAGGVSVVLCGTGGDAVTIEIDLGGNPPPAHPMADCLAHCLATAPAIAALPAAVASPSAIAEMALWAPLRPSLAPATARQAPPARAPPISPAT